MRKWSENLRCTKCGYFFIAPKLTHDPETNREVFKIKCARCLSEEYVLPLDAPKDDFPWHIYYVQKEEEE